MNDKIKILSPAERIRAVFYFRNRRRSPPILENAAVIANFISFANGYTTNIQLQQNWNACLNVTGRNRLKAASLFVHYGWSPDFREEHPRSENSFFTVEEKDGNRHYKIVEDEIEKRFLSVESYSLDSELPWLIQNQHITDDRKKNLIRADVMPLFWSREGIKMSLTTEDRLLCYDRIDDYIARLLLYNIFDGISLCEHLLREEIDKSDPGFSWAAPQEFTLSENDFRFEPYHYNIDAEYNKEHADELGAARSLKKAQKNFESVTGDEWTTQELYAQGINQDKIARLVKNGLIERTSKGHYRRISR